MEKIDKNYKGEHEITVFFFYSKGKEKNDRNYKGKHEITIFFLIISLIVVKWDLIKGWKQHSNFLIFGLAKRKRTLNESDHKFQHGSLNHF